MSSSPDYDLMPDAVGNEMDSLDLSVLFGPDGKCTGTNHRNEPVRRLMVAEKDAKPSQSHAHWDIKANRNLGDRNESTAQPFPSRASMYRETIDPKNIRPYPFDRSVEQGNSSLNGNFWHITDKTVLLNILRRNRVVIFSEISPELMDEIKEVSHVYILQSSEEARLEDPDAFQDALGVFFSLMDRPMHYTNQNQWKFYFVDPSLDPESRGPDIECNTLQYYQYGELICENMLGVRKAAVPTAKSMINHKPTEKAKKGGSVVLPCPLAEKKGCCAAAEMLQWKCAKCNRALEYGFDENFYCDCGKAPADFFVFHCGKPRHGREHVGFPDIDAVLQLIKPFKETNILVLGETGVGKSTWINGFGNFLTYDTLDEALQDPVYLIPAQFTTIDCNFKKKLISMGSSDNEATLTGQSATQMPKTYTFKKGNVLVRLIDTPGIGDTRGTEQDKKNFVNIMHHLSNYETLHGICILLKPNNSRLTVMFQFCIKELLTHLHRDACHNIVFVFTNARGTLYRPGDTLPTLEELIKSSNGVDITLRKDTVYCVDNEAVRFMAVCKAGEKFDESERDSFVKSWEKSMAETKRLLHHISTLTPHVLQSTLSLNEARRMILSFTEPLAHITQNIEVNLKLADDKAREIQTTKCSQEKLRRKLYVPVMDIEPVQLDYPRTVCTSQSCIRLVRGQADFVTWCHPHCNLVDIEPNQYPHPGLKRCAAMVASGGQTCSNCQCSWEKHMHITYEMREIQSQEIDQSIVDLMRHKDGEIAAVERLVGELEQRKLNLLAEGEQIRKVSAMFGYFLKKNAMLPYNDAMESYLQHLISAEKEKVAIGATRDRLRNYEKLLAAYCEEKRVLDEAMQDEDDEHQITARDIDQAMRSLFSLRINGQTIRNLVDAVQNAHGQQVRHSETVYAAKQCRKNARKRQGMFGTAGALDPGNEDLAHDAGNSFEQHRAGRLSEDTDRLDLERSQHFERNRWVDRRRYQEDYRMRGYGDSRRMGPVSERGSDGCMTEYRNYGWAERMSESYHCGLPRGRGLCAGDNQMQPPNSRPSWSPSDVSDRLNILQRTLRNFEDWVSELFL